MLGNEKPFTETQRALKPKINACPLGLYDRGAALYVQAQAKECSAVSVRFFHPRSPVFWWPFLFRFNHRGEAVMPHPVDVQLGQRLRQIRIHQGMSQGQLAQQLGITFQQIQKYEKGHNRIAVSRLFDIAQVFQLPIQYFLCGFHQFKDDRNGQIIGWKE